jgi:integrase
LKMATYTQRESGQWQAKIRAKGYPAQSKVFRTKTEAQNWVKVVESEMTRGVFVSRSEAENTTMRQALERYLREVSIKKKGYAQERVKINQLLKNKISDRTLASLQPKDFAKFRDELSQTLAPATVVKHLAIFSHLFNTAQKEWGINVDNPITKIKKPSINNSRTRRLVGDEEELMMSQLAKSRNIWLKPVCEFALETAMRQSEILSLTWSNVFDEYAKLNDTKNGESRDVPLSPRAREILAVLPRSITGRVFCTTASAVVQGWEHARRNAAVDENDKRFDDLRFHDLRHEATSRLAEKLPNPLDLASVTGHKDLQMLKRYYHPRAEDLAKKLV